MLLLSCWSFTHDPVPLAAISVLPVLVFGTDASTFAISDVRFALSVDPVGVRDRRTVQPFILAGPGVVLESCITIRKVGMLIYRLRVISFSINIFILDSCFR